VRSHHSNHPAAGAPPGRPAGGRGRDPEAAGLGARTSTPAYSSSADRAATSPTTSASWPAPPCSTQPARCWSFPV